MIKIGKKAKEWEQARRELKVEFEEMGITTCEAMLPNCWGNNGLGFAHTKKRRDVEDLKRVVLSCNNCHQKFEYASERWTGLSMENFLEGIIERRQHNDL